LLLTSTSKEASMAESRDWKMDDRRGNDDLSGIGNEDIVGRLNEDDEEFEDEDTDDVEDDEDPEESER
jgi:hypothetical protein